MNARSQVKYRALSRNILGTPVPSILCTHNISTYLHIASSDLIVKGFNLSKVLFSEKKTYAKYRYMTKKLIVNPRNFFPTKSVYITNPRNFNPTKINDYTVLQSKSLPSQSRKMPSYLILKSWKIPGA